MSKWATNYVQFERNGIINAEDLIEMENKWGTWATHSAISQSNPNTATREQIFNKVRELRQNVDHFVNP